MRPALDVEVRALDGRPRERRRGARCPAVGAVLRQRRAGGGAVAWAHIGAAAWAQKECAGKALFSSHPINPVNKKKIVTSNVSIYVWSTK